MRDIDDGYDYQLNLRGEYNRKGDAIPRGYSASNHGGDASFHSSAVVGLELAERVASNDNPSDSSGHRQSQLAMVVWYGIVDTPNDFGRLGDTPSHPELLDWLAVAIRSIKVGRSSGLCVRYCSVRHGSSRVRPACRPSSGDPDNRLLHHYPLRRLEAEMVRDAML